MILEKLSLINYKNIREAMLVLSPKINCMIGRNGVGKTNILDAVYFLSFCHSASNPVDSMLIRHGEEFMLIEGTYKADSASSSDDTTIISCGLKKGTKKHFRRNKKEYRRLSEHIGMIPLVMISPSDAMLIEGGSEERRRLMDMADPEIMSLWEEQMAMEGERIYERRRVFVNELTPIFQRYYECISGNREQVAIEYVSHCQRGPLLDVIQRDRQKDRIMGFSLHGTHRDDLVFSLSGHPIKREGSQGQHKTFAIALKLAQFDFLKRTNGGNTPLLLLDDIFDKLDSSRVEQIVKLVAGEEFGQIFITDTNREHLDQILEATSHDYKIFQVEGGEIDV